MPADVVSFVFVVMPGFRLSADREEQVEKQSQTIRYKQAASERFPMASVKMI